MPQLSLKKIIRKDFGPVLQGLLDSIDEPIGILDAEGDLLIGSLPDPSGEPQARAPIQREGETAGWVIGGTGSPWIANLAGMLEFWLSKEAEKRALANEVLDKYRELSLLYRFSEKLVVSPRPDSIAKMTLSEVCPLMQVAGGLVVLAGAGGDELEVLATCGQSFPHILRFLDGDSILQKVLQTGVGQIANSLPADHYFEEMGGQQISLLCAPLRSEKRVLGAVIMVGGESRIFTAGDLKLVSTVAMQTAPAIEIANLHQKELEQAVLERDLQTAYRVQAGLLPHEMPHMDGWNVAAYWKPAREVGGDFYEFFPLPDGRQGIAIADVSDKGVSAALVMANTHSVLRGVAASLPDDELVMPGDLLARINNVLCEDTPMSMFITCLLILVDPQSGRLCFSNAGHNLPYIRKANGAIELHATGVPLGIFPNMTYDSSEAELGRGESLIMYSDGLVEAHNQQGEMFGYQRLDALMDNHGGAEASKGEDFIRYLLSQLNEFAGPHWDQEDDVTIVAIDRN